MKKRIKKTIALLTLTVAVLGTSVTSFAASCLDVRDYQKHRYAQRTYYVETGDRTLLYIANGVMHYSVKREVWGVCVCGEHRIQGYDYVDRYRSIQ